MWSLLWLCFVVFFFFFQAEDGIRDGRVTGVQTCALPIYGDRLLENIAANAGQRHLHHPCIVSNTGHQKARAHLVKKIHRSEERRVGKECRSRWSPNHLKKKREK